ncbi:hypothetical protein EJ03DRAFT_16168 [Teratosphaeria nubilosa]|uniref:Uncharacterized protein n=1 Tax=Teratosphaeria nubilosa TaxID=161662 RepID=A0A6G1KVM7_9PEZI|nr:hypothetical protein EJ03DRAFT_16168 [Teratosphaeria nubilosa]
MEDRTMQCVFVAEQREFRCCPVVPIALYLASVQLCSQRYPATCCVARIYETSPQCLQAAVATSHRKSRLAAVDLGISELCANTVESRTCFEHHCLTSNLALVIGLAFGIQHCQFHIRAARQVTKTSACMIAAGIVPPAGRRSMPPSSKAFYSGLPRTSHRVKASRLEMQLGRRVDQTTLLRR